MPLGGKRYVILANGRGPTPAGRLYKEILGKTRAPTDWGRTTSSDSTTETESSCRCVAKNASCSGIWRETGKTDLTPKPG